MAGFFKVGGQFLALIFHFKTPKKIEIIQNFNFVKVFSQIEKV